ncbi:3-dehydrosphinganine reductase-like [Branchiostoma floridae x Branchiostoma belcheri]
MQFFPIESGAVMIALAVFVGFVIMIFMLSPLISPRPMKLNGSHVMVTGGSSGIGKAVAVEAVKQGALVTIIARNEQRLLQAKKEIEQHMRDKDRQKVLCISVDISKDFSAVEKAVQQAQEKLGPVDMLVNCAGTSFASRFEDIPVDEFKQQMEVNYYGTVHATRAVISTMKYRRRGRIVLVSSQAGQIGLYGFTAYSASKFALRGFAEALQMEVKPYNIYLTITFPPDTDTPGFQTEQTFKPKETKLISETAGLYQPDYVAKRILQDASVGTFLSYIGLDGYLLASATCGMSPLTSMTEGMQQVLTMGVFRVIALFYLGSFDRMVARCAVEREKEMRERQDKESRD